MVDGVRPSSYGDKMEIPLDMRTKCQRFSRIVGYYSPVDRWNPGKQSEFKDRKVYVVGEKDV
jgi:hypothetical protein